jgi:hypothetical protein
MAMNLRKTGTSSDKDDVRIGLRESRGQIMYHELYDVVEFEIIGDYTLRVKFDDSTEQIINFEPVLYGELWGPLRNLEFFNQVRLDSEAKTLVWPNGADFDPETLRNWPKYKDKLARRARSWAKITA